MTNKNDPLGLDSLGLGDLGFSSHPSSSKHSKSQKEKEEEEMMNQIAEEVVLEAVLGVHLSEEDKAMVDGLSAVEDAGEASKQQEQEVSRWAVQSELTARMVTSSTKLRLRSRNTFHRSRVWLEKSAWPAGGYRSEHEDHQVKVDRRRTSSRSRLTRLYVSR